MSADHLPQSSSSSRFTAGCFGFLLLRATALPFFGGIMSYQPVETLTHARMFRVRARLPYPIGPPDVSAMAVSVVARAASGSPSFSIISAISASQARAIAAQLFARTKLGEDGAENFRHLAKRRRHCGRGLGPPLDFREHKKQSFSCGCPIAIVFIWTKEI